MTFTQPSDQGARKVSIELTVDMWLFIVSGLKDLAAVGKEDIDLCPGLIEPEDLMDMQEVVNDNLEVAALIERSLD